MDKPFCTYKIINTDSESYFIGANTEEGFKLIPGDIFNEANFDRVFILKGGPGTGKSTLMKKAASKALNCGGSAVKYYCSSDPDSLDAVVITLNSKKYLICDGTAPHVTEMEYPGAISEIINLGTMWDAEKLSAERETIIKLSSEKSSLFKNAYKYLASAHEILNSLRNITQKICDTDKITAAAKRFSEKFRKSKGNISYVYTEAFSMKGTVAVDTFLKKADEIYYISDAFGISNIYMNLVSENLDSMEVGHVKIISPVNSDSLAGIYIEKDGVLLTSASYVGDVPFGKTVNMKRFLNGHENDYRGKYKFGAKCLSALLSGAGDCLAEARDKHFALEKIYVSAMNFKKVDRVYRDNLQKYFEL